MDINYTAVVSLATVGFCIMYYITLRGFINATKGNQGHIDEVDSAINVFFALVSSAALTAVSVLLTISLSAYTPSAMIFMVAVPALLIVTAKVAQ
jgi:hypothetical protein